MKNEIKIIANKLSKIVGIKVNINELSELKEYIEDILPLITFNDYYHRGYQRNFVNFSTYLQTIEGDSCCDMEASLRGNKEDLKCLMEEKNNFDMSEIEIWDYKHETNPTCFEEIDGDEFEVILRGDEGCGIVANTDAYLEMKKYSKFSIDYFYFLETIMNFTRKNNCEILVSTKELHPLECNGTFSNRDIQWSVNKGYLGGGGTHFVKKSKFDVEDLWQLWRLCWLYETMYDEEFNKINLNIDFEKGFLENINWTINTECGLWLILNHKYSCQQLPTDKQTVLKLVSKYPIVYSKLPFDLRNDKDIVLQFIKANSPFVRKFIESRENTIEIDENGNQVLLSLQNIDEKNSEIFLNGMPTGCNSCIPIEVMSHSEILQALEQDMWEEIIINDENYSEINIIEIINEAYGIIPKVFYYWQCKLETDLKTVASLIRLYNLDYKSQNNELAMYKCLFLIESKNVDHTLAYMELFAIVAEMLLHKKFAKNATDGIRKIFQTLPASIQNMIVKENYALIKFMKADDIDKDFVEFIVKNCPNATEILHDEFILKYGLKVIDLDAEKVCERCEKCEKYKILLDIINDRYIKILRK